MKKHFRKSSKGGNKKRRKLNSSSSYVPTNYSSPSTSSNPLLGYSTDGSVYSRRSSFDYGRVGAQVAGAALGYVSDYGTVSGFETGGELYDLVEGSKSNVFSTKKMVGSSTYVGKMNKNRKTKQTFATKAATKGFHVTNETYGSVSDPFAVYIHHSTRQLRLEVKALMGAIIRKGLEMAGIQLSSNFEELPFTSPALSAGAILNYLVMNPSTGAIITYAYTTVDNQTLNSIVDAWTDMDTHLFDYLRNANALEPHRFCVYLIDAASTSSSKVASNFNIGEMHVTMISGSHLKIQNRTKGDLSAAGDQSTDRNDNQPLICQSYLLQSGDVRQKHIPGAIGSSTAQVLNGSALSGPNLIRSSQLTSAGFQNRLSPSHFTNCKKTASSILQPGTMKQSFVMHKFSGLMLNVFKRMRCVSIETGDIVVGLQGRSELFIFEEKMRTAGTNPVFVHYEREYKVGCIATVKKRTPFVTYLTDGVKNNNSA